MARKKTAIELHVVKKAKELRKAQGMSQADLAFKLDVSYGFIGHVESKTHSAKYNLNHIDKLSFIFGCSPQEFLPKKSLTKKID